MGRRGISVILVIFALVLSTWPGQAQSGKQFEVHGFVLGNLSRRTACCAQSAGDGFNFLLGEERVRLEVFTWATSVEAAARLKADLLHDAAAGQLDMDIREAYVDYTTGDFDFRVGRQIITWGVGDFLFINDVFPKDWVSFFSGRSLEYLKLGVDGLRTHYSSQILNMEVIVIPFFKPDNVPTSERFLLYDPYEGVRFRDRKEPATTLSNAELALRGYRRMGNVDFSIYAYRGFWRIPSTRPDNITHPARVLRFYPGLSVYGFSARRSALRGVLSFEAGYYDSRNDREGHDPVIPNSETRVLVGYQRELWKDFTVGAQFYREAMRDYGAYRNTLSDGLPVRNRFRDTVTVQLEQLMKHQAWKLTLFSFYSPSDNDWLLQPRVSYRFSNRLSGTLGANLIGGVRTTTLLGRLRENDNIFATAIFYF